MYDFPSHTYIYIYIYVYILMYIYIYINVLERPQKTSSISPRQFIHLLFGLYHSVIILVRFVFAVLSDETV